MIRAELKELNVTPRSLRRFGFLVGGIFLLLGAWFIYRHKPVGPYFLAPGILLTALGALAPSCLRKVYIGWMAAALVMGLVVSTVLLTLFFFLVVTPVGWIARLTGQDFLSLKLDRSAPSYWLKKAPVKRSQPVDYERQY